MRTLLLLTCFILTPLQAGEIHKWVDSEGNVYYGDAPPVNIKSQNVRVQRPPSDPGRALPRLPLSGAEVSTDTETSSGPAPRAALDPDASPEEIACHNARTDLDVIMSSSRVKLQAADGSSRYMTAEELEQRKAQAEADIDQFCE